MDGRAESRKAAAKKAAPKAVAKTAAAKKAAPKKAAPKRAAPKQAMARVRTATEAEAVSDSGPTGSEAETVDVTSDVAPGNVGDAERSDDIPRERRRLPVSRRVFTPVDLRRIALAAEACLAEKGSARLRVDLRGVEGDEYEGSIQSLLLPDTYLVQRRIRGVEIQGGGGPASIHIELTHGSTYWEHRNEVRVAGTDTMWVDGTRKRLEDEINRTKPQLNVTTSVKVLVGVVLALACAAVSIRVGFLLASFEPELDRFESPAFVSWTYAGVVVGALGGLGSIFVGVFAPDELASMWPSVELRTGSEYMDKDYRKRSIVLLMISALVVPFIVNVLSNTASG